MTPNSEPTIPNSCRLPADLGYRMPAEWEAHEATWLSWPHNKTTWPGKHLKAVQSVYLQMIQALLPHEQVHLLVRDETEKLAVVKSLELKKITIKNLSFQEVDTVDAWIRDYGPLFVKKRSDFPKESGAEEKETAFTKWIFNAWGGKYDDLAEDNGVVDRLKVLEEAERFDSGIVLEGGSVDLNGEGICLTTEQCLLNPNRNKGLSRKQLEGHLKNYLGAEKVIWLKEGIEGDDTDGHVDDIARFVNPETVLAATEPDSTDRNHAVLKENLEILKTREDLRGKRFRVVELPMPGRLYAEGGELDGERIPASYANFYIANEMVLVPLYSHKNDKLALQIIKDLFPSRKAVGIECTSLVHGLGSIHCVTQQQPL